MTRTKSILLTLAMLFLWSSAYLTDLDLGGFGHALLIAAFVFAISAIATGRQDSRPL